MVVPHKTSSSMSWGWFGISDDNNKRRANLIMTPNSHTNDMLKTGLTSTQKTWPSVGPPQCSLHTWPRAFYITSQPYSIGFGLIARSLTAAMK